MFRGLLPVSTTFYHVRRAPWWQPEVLPSGTLMQNQSCLEVSHPRRGSSHTLRLLTQLTSLIAARASRGRVRKLEIRTCKKWLLT